MPASAKSADLTPPAFAKSGPHQARILIADDQQHILDAMEFLLKPLGYKVDAVRSPVLAREALATASYDAVLIDLNYTRDTTSGQEGLDLLSEIVGLDGTQAVIVMTAWGNVELAVEAMRRGARDFIQKPWENERLLSIVRTQVELHRALQEAERLAAASEGAMRVMVSRTGDMEGAVAINSGLPSVPSSRLAVPDDALGELSQEMNALADLLSRHRTGAIEATALLQRVVEEVDIPIFAFDPGGTLRLVNSAGEKLMQRGSSHLLGKTASELGLQSSLSCENEALLSLPFMSGARWVVRRSSFRQQGIPHTLVVLSDVSRALHEEERLGNV